jgi:hypothetical protein
MALEEARNAYQAAQAAVLDADAALAAAAVAWRRAEREDGLPAGHWRPESEAWNAARIARQEAGAAESRAWAVYSREIYAATYGHGGRP